MAWVEFPWKPSGPGEITEGASQPENSALPDWALGLLLASKFGPMPSGLNQDFRSVLTN